LLPSLFSYQPCYFLLYQPHRLFFYDSCYLVSNQPLLYQPCYFSFSSIGSLSIICATSVSANLQFRFLQWDPYHNFWLCEHISVYCLFHRHTPLVNTRCECGNMYQGSV
jgi:hypothetical protein